MNTNPPFFYVLILMCMCGLLGLISGGLGRFATDGCIYILFPEQQQQDKVDFGTAENGNLKFSLSLSLPDGNLYKHL